MTAPIEDHTGTAGSRTFTQAEVDAIVRDRLKRERDATATKYADYDTLKATAAEADKTKTQLDKVLEKLTAAEERTAKLESQQTRAAVVAAKKLPAALAKRLQGKTEDELNADADELIADWKAAGGKIEGDDADAAPAAASTPAPRGRPRETLHSGAPIPETPTEETNPLKLAALIPRN